MTSAIKVAKSRPLGISLLSALTFLSAAALLLRTILLRSGGLAGLSRLLAVLILATIVIGLWKLWNPARVWLFFLVVVDALTSLVVVFAYALPQSRYGLAGEVIVQFCLAVGLIWYLQSAPVRHAFGGFSAWPQTAKMLVLTIFTTLLAFPFGWMGVATFKQNLDLYATDNNPFLFNLEPTLDHLRYLFGQTDYLTWLRNTALVGLAVVLITLVLSLPAAYALARLTGRWGERLGIAIFLTYLVPPTLLFIPLSRVVAILGLQDTLWSLVLVYPSITVQFSIWLLMRFFKSIPRELEDAAMVDGLTRFGA